MISAAWPTLATTPRDNFLLIYDRGVEEDPDNQATAEVGLNVNRIGKVGQQGKSKRCWLMNPTTLPLRSASPHR